MNRLILSVVAGLALASYSFLSNARAEEADSQAATTAGEGHDSGPTTEAAEKPQQGGGEKDEAKKKDRKTYTVRPRPLKIEDSVDGEFVATKMSEVILRPEEWSQFKIKEVVGHGTKVEEGQNLIKFDREELLEAIADLEIDLHLNELKINRAEEEIPQKERALERQLDDAEETVRRVEEDFRRYTETERKQSLDSAEMSLKIAKFELDYYTDELEQLEKMYEADDLTEETEEIVLRRQRFYVEYAKFNYGLAKYSRERTVNVTIPRRDRDIEESLKAAKDRLDQAQTASQLDLRIARYELEKLKEDRKKSSKKHADLLSDKSLMTVKSPVAGIVYYGKCDDGKWNQLDGLRGKLIPGSNADKDSVLMTVVDTSSPYFLVKLDGKYLISLHKGQVVEIEPSVEGAEKIKGSVASVSAVPISSGKFEAKVEFANDLPDWLVPGISGKAAIVVYEKKDALLVPADAVHKEEGTDEEYVWLVKDDKVKKTPVKTGKAKGKHVEIKSGLSRGDIISLDDEKENEEETGQGEQ